MFTRVSTELLSMKWLSLTRSWMYGLNDKGREWTNVRMMESYLGVGRNVRWGGPPPEENKPNSTGSLREEYEYGLTDERSDWTNVRLCSI